MLIRYQHSVWRRIFENLDEYLRKVTKFSLFDRRAERWVKTEGVSGRFSQRHSLLGFSVSYTPDSPEGTAELTLLTLRSSFMAPCSGSPGEPQLPVKSAAPSPGVLLSCFMTQSRSPSPAARASPHDVHLLQPRPTVPGLSEPHICSGYALTTVFVLYSFVYLHPTYPVYFIFAHLHFLVSCNILFESWVILGPNLHTSFPKSPGWL